jgi:transposase
MREHDGRKLDHTTLEQLRIRAVRQVEHGAHPEDVAQALGMTKAAVYAWLAKYREGGLEALKAARSLDGHRNCRVRSLPGCTP